MTLSIFQRIALVALLAGNNAAAFQTQQGRTPFSGSTSFHHQHYPSVRLSALQADEITTTKKSTREGEVSQTNSVLTQVLLLDQEDQIKASFDLSSDEIIAPVQTDSAADDGAVMGGLFWRGVVVMLCALWASNFPAAKLIMAEPGVDSSLYAVARFGVAALALLPGAIISTRKTGMDWETFKSSVLCGSFVAFGYLGQTLGLMTTTASKACVICSLHCVFVAIVAEAMRVNKAKATMGGNPYFNFKRLVPAAIAVAGVAVVELQGAAGGPNVGDLLSFAQPIGFGLGYLTLEELMTKRPETAVAVSAIKLSVVALASFAMFELTPLIQNGAESWSFTVPEFGAIMSSPVALGGILYTGLVTTALALFVESKAFARVPATDASLILTTEPLFAAGLGAVTLGETFGMSDYAGASLIIGACALATLMDDENRDEDCKPDDISCEAPRSFPFGSQ